MSDVNIVFSKFKPDDFGYDSTSNIWAQKLVKKSIFSPTPTNETFVKLAISKIFKIYFLDVNEVILKGKQVKRFFEKNLNLFYLRLYGVQTYMDRKRRP